MDVCLWEAEFVSVATIDDMIECAHDTYSLIILDDCSSIQVYVQSWPNFAG